MSLALVTAALQTTELLGTALRIAAQTGARLRTSTSPVLTLPPGGPQTGPDPQPPADPSLTSDSDLTQVPRPLPAPPLPSDFRLTPVMKELLQPALTAGGFRILDQQRRAYTKVIVHSLVRNGSKQVSMLALPAAIADNPVGDTVLAFASLEYGFDVGTYVCLLSENVDSPHRSLREVIERSWPNQSGRSLRVKWLPWRDLKDLPKAVTAADRLEALKDLFDLSAQAAAMEVKRELSPQDKIALTLVLAKIDDFSDATSRKTSLGLAGLAPFSDLPGDTARQACGALVLRLEQAGGDPPPLRLLVNYVLSCDLPDDKKKVVTDLITRYRFLS